MKVWVLEYSVYNARGELTFRDTKGLFVSQKKASRIMREDADAKRYNRVNPEYVVNDVRSVVLKSQHQSEVWQVVAFHVDDSDE